MPRVTTAVGSIHLATSRLSTGGTRTWLRVLVGGGRYKVLAGPFDTVREAERERAKILAVRAKQGAA